MLHVLEILARARQENHACKMRQMRSAAGIKRLNNKQQDMLSVIDDPQQVTKYARKSNQQKRGQQPHEFNYTQATRTTAVEAMKT